MSNPNCLPVPNEVHLGLWEEVTIRTGRDWVSAQNVAVAGRRLYAAKWWRAAAADKVQNAAKSRETTAGAPLEFFFNFLTADRSMKCCISPVYF